jgi:CBS domain-containing protein
MIRDYVPPQLGEIREKVLRGERPTVVVRTLLSWFLATYRTRSTVHEIDSTLRALGLTTEPYFNYTYLGATVTFVPSKPPSANGKESEGSESKVEAAESLVQSDAIATSVGLQVDPIYRIGRLAIANRPPVSVTPDATIKQAVTLMLSNDFSQLPVMTSEREVKGLFSWKSLGTRISQKLSCERVSDATDGHAEVSADASLFKAIALLQEHDCILVRDSTKKITGVITAYDISFTFGQLAEPFLVLGEIENHIRVLIGPAFSRDELADVRDPGDSARTIDTVEDLTFGEYLRLLENPDRWGKLRWEIDRVIFIKQLDEVRAIRNDVMHFDPEGVDEADLAKLRTFNGFLCVLSQGRNK